MFCAAMWPTLGYSSPSRMARANSPCPCCSSCGSSQARPVTPAVVLLPKPRTSAARLSATVCASSSDGGAPSARAIALLVCDPALEVPWQLRALMGCFGLWLLMAAGGRSPTHGLYPPAVALKYRAWYTFSSAECDAAHLALSAALPSAEAMVDMYCVASTW